MSFDFPKIKKQLAFNLVNFYGKWYKLLGQSITEQPTIALANQTTSTTLSYTRNSNYKLAIGKVTYVCEDANGAYLKVACNSPKWDKKSITIGSTSTTLTYEFGAFQFAENYTLELEELAKFPIIVSSGESATFFLINSHPSSNITFRWIAHLMILEELTNDELERLFRE